MEENKNLTPETENAEETAAENTPAEETTAEQTGEKKEKKVKKEKKAKKPKKLKNQALLRRGGYSVAITAAVLAGLIVLNVLVNALSNRFVLEFDMSTEKENSMSADNIKYLKDLDKEVNITVCAEKDGYTGGYMGYYAKNLYGVSSDASKYFEQTLKLLDKYPAYNNKITLKYVDTQGSEFTEISQKYSNEKLAYGDIIVSAKGSDNNERYKVLGFKDVYQLSEDNTYAAYGYSQSTVSGNSVETAVTSAIAYVTSSKTKKVALLTGHSKTDYTADYQKLLKANNYEIETISDNIVGKISSDFDAVIIAGPTTDFIGSELDNLSDFLDNDGKLGKGLLFFADASAPYLTNLYDFLSQWGIAIEEGILFETNTNNHIPDDPMTMGIYPTSSDESLTSGMQLCITGYNVPMSAAFESENGITVTSLMSSLESVVAAPVGTAANWKGADNYTKKSFPAVLQAAQSEYDDDNKQITSYVFAFDSVQFIQSEYNEQSSVSNKNLTLACAERAVGAEDTGISFVSKTITNESFADSVSETSAGIVRIIFMGLLPVACIAAGIYIFIRRKNA